VTQYCRRDLLADVRSQSSLKVQCSGICSTYGQPLGVIALGGGEEGLEGVVGGDNKAGGVDEELSSNVEEDKEEVEGAEAENNVDLGNVGLLLKLLQLRVLGQLLVELGQVELCCSGGQSGCDTLGKATTIAALAEADSCDDCDCDYVPLSWMEPPWALILAVCGCAGWYVVCG
jgi:hypothetical protein